MESTLKQQEMALMDKWRAKLHAEKLIPKESDFNADGIVNYEQWDSLQRRSLPKLLFVLKETDEHSGPLIEPLADHGGNGKTWAGVAKWADALLFGKYGHANKPYRKNIISNIAAINVKKVAGGTSSDWEDIQAAIIRDRDLLKAQIELYQPDIIIGCWHWYMAKYIVKDIMQEVEDPRWEWLDKDKQIRVCISHMFGRHKSVLVIDMRHPCRARNIWADKLVAFRKSARWKELFGNRFIEV